jgi:hypothetical protein
MRDDAYDGIFKILNKKAYIIAHKLFPSLALADLLQDVRRLSPFMTYAMTAASEVGIWWQAPCVCNHTSQWLTLV